MKGLTRFIVVPVTVVAGTILFTKELFSAFTLSELLGIAILLTMLCGFFLWRHEAEMRSTLDQGKAEGRSAIEYNRLREEKKRRAREMNEYLMQRNLVKIMDTFHDEIGRR